MSLRDETLDSLGKELTWVIETTSLAAHIGIKVKPEVLEDRLLRCKDLVNQLKRLEQKGGELT